MLCLDFERTFQITFWNVIVRFCTFIIECDLNENMIKKYDRTLKRISYKNVKYNNQFLMVWSRMYIWDNNIVECDCLILYVHQRMWSCKLISNYKKSMYIYK